MSLPGSRARSDEAPLPLPRQQGWLLALLGAAGGRAVSSGLRRVERGTQHESQQRLLVVLGRQMGYVGEQSVHLKPHAPHQSAATTQLGGFGQVWQPAQPPSWGQNRNHTEELLSLQNLLASLLLLFIFVGFFLCLIGVHEGTLHSVSVQLSAP